MPHAASNSIDPVDPAAGKPWLRLLFSAPGRQFARFTHVVRSLGAFAIITLGVMLTKARVAPGVIHALTRRQLAMAGVQLFPMVGFLATALGLVVIGQSVSLLTRVGANSFLGTIMVTAVVRELGPLITALLVLTQAGTRNVIELGTARALGEVEALEVMGIDPIHYLVVPRVIGMAVATFALTVYLILGALLSGYLWAFIQDVPLTPDQYFQQLAESLRGLDFVLLGLKTILFGSVIAIATCYQGLARPLDIQQLSRATVAAIANAVVGCILLDALFLIAYLIA